MAEPFLDADAAAALHDAYLAALTEEERQAFTHAVQVLLLRFENALLTHRQYHDTLTPHVAVEALLVLLGKLEADLLLRHEAP